jgi:hypothetical protein
MHGTRGWYVAPVSSYKGGISASTPFNTPVIP